jgi:hypothetical protein
MQGKRISTLDKVSCLLIWVVIYLLSSLGNSFIPYGLCEIKALDHLISKISSSSNLLKLVCN